MVYVVRDEMDSCEICVHWQVQMGPVRVKVQVGMQQNSMYEYKAPTERKDEEGGEIER